jgi:DNA-binding LacI/PurR family transcriptional regulator
MACDRFQHSPRLTVRPTRCRGPSTTRPRCTPNCARVDAAAREFHDIPDGSARALPTQDARPKALACGNDVIAYGVLLEAERRGLSVPKSLSVMGFDDLEWSRHLRPSLTTIHLPTDEVWRRAGEYLMNVLTHHPAVLHHEVDASVVVRESTGPAPREAGAGR